MQHALKSLLDYAPCVVLEKAGVIVPALPPGAPLEACIVRLDIMQYRRFVLSKGTPYFLMYYDYGYTLAQERSSADCLGGSNRWRNRLSNTFSFHQS